MTITTISCPTSMTHSSIKADSAPVWVDAYGNNYYITSGLIEDVNPTESKKATPKEVVVICGLPGLEALSLMGLTPKPVEI